MVVVLLDVGVALNTTCRGRIDQTLPLQSHQAAGTVDPQTHRTLPPL